MIPDFLLSGGAGGLTVAPSSSASSGHTNSTLNFGNSQVTTAGGNASTAASGSGFSTGHLLIAGIALVMAAFLVGRK